MAAPTTVSIPHQLGRAEVTMEIQLPGVLGMITSGLKNRLRKVGQLLLTKEWRRCLRETQERSWRDQFQRIE